MTTVHVDATLPDDERRARLFAGDLFVFSPRPSALALAELARDLVEEAFGGRDPRTAQHDMPVQQFAAVLADVKPRFIHDPRCKALIGSLMTEVGVDPSQTYFDVPRLRSATAQDYLSTGIAYAFHPHRDTWYSAPHCQVNWWFPVYDIEADNGLAFHPRYFSEPVANGSAAYNYYEWNATSRGDAARHIGTDTRRQPKPEQHVELDPQVRVVAPVGGVLMFSGAQLHSTVPNTTQQTRWSIDFRTVALADARTGAGAPNVDSASTGTTMRDYLRGTDLAHLPDEVVAAYDTAPPVEGQVAVYRPDLTPA